MGIEVKRLLLPVRLVGVPEFPKTTIWEGKSWKLLDERDEVLAFLGMAKEYPWKWKIQLGLEHLVDDWIIWYRRIERYFLLLFFSVCQKGVQINFNMTHEWQFQYDSWMDWSILFWGSKISLPSQHTACISKWKIWFWCFPSKALVLQSLFCQFKGVRATPALPQLTLNVGSVENSSKDDLSVQKRVCIESSILVSKKPCFFFSVVLRIPKSLKAQV